jgi:excisionase family DNA binding protein
LDEAADALGIGKTTLKQLIANGDIPSLKIGKRRLVRRATLEKFIARREAGIYR